MKGRVKLAFKKNGKKGKNSEVCIIIIKKHFWGCSGPEGSHTHQYFPSLYVCNHAWGRLFVNCLGDVLI